MSKGFLRFYDLLHQLVERGQHDGSFRDDVSVNVLSSAMMGAAEGMIRDRMIAERSGKFTGYDDPAIRNTFVAMVNALGHPQPR